MNRRELVVTIAGLIATFFLPWPQSDEALERRTSVVARSIDSVRASPPPGLYESGRVRTGPTGGIQPTR